MEYTTGTRVFHDWIIVRKIGQGTIGNVYEIKRRDEENKEGGMDRKESDTLCVRVSVLRESLHPDKTEVFQYMKCSLGKVVTDIPDLEIYEKDDQTVIAEKRNQI